MRLISVSDWNAFLSCLDGLMDTPQVQSMRSLPHHPGVNCYEHSVFVAYTAFRLARRWGLDYRACARGGLLHDLYLYDCHDRTAHPGNQCLDHPEFALRNASALCPDLSEREKNAIVSHMFPLAVHLPRCREALVVNMADKICATLEVVHLYQTRRVQRWLPLSAA